MQYNTLFSGLYLYLTVIQQMQRQKSEILSALKLCSMLRLKLHVYENFAKL